MKGQAELQDTQHGKRYTAMTGYPWEVKAMSHRMRRREFLEASGRAWLRVACLPLVVRVQANQQSLESKHDLPSKPVIADLEKQIPKLMEEAKVPGLSIAIIKDAKLFWRRGFGVKDATSKEPVDNDTVFEAASTSKPVFAYAVMKLCEKGVMDLNTPLTKYAPERFLKGDPRLDLITARHVNRQRPRRGRCPNTTTATLVRASQQVGLILPGMIKEPGSFSGIVTSAKPVRRLVGRHSFLRSCIRGTPNVDVHIRPVMPRSPLSSLPFGFSVNCPISVRFSPHNCFPRETRRRPCFPRTILRLF